jgi:hypothetical protein
MLARDEFEAGSRWLMVGIAIVVIGILLVRKVGWREVLDDIFSLPRTYLDAKGSMFFPMLFVCGGVCIAIGIARLAR